MARARQLLRTRASGVNFSVEIRATTGSRRSCIYEDGNILAEVNSRLRRRPLCRFERALFPLHAPSRVTGCGLIVPWNYAKCKKYERSCLKLNDHLVDAVSKTVIVYDAISICVSPWKTRVWRKFDGFDGEDGTHDHRDVCISARYIFVDTRNLEKKQRRRPRKPE